jgi:hypothetical protein
VWVSTSAWHEVFDCRFDKLPHARLNPSPHHAMVACLIRRRRAAEVSNRSPYFCHEVFCHKKAHKTQNQLMTKSDFYFVSYVPFCG